MATQLSLIRPLCQALARARFKHYDELRRQWEDHLKTCAICGKIVSHKHIVRCDAGHRLYSEMTTARNTSLEERL